MNTIDHNAAKGQARAIEPQGRTIEDLAASVANDATRLLLRDGRVHALAFVFDAGLTALGAMTLDEEEDWRSQLERTLGRIPVIGAYVLVNECWTRDPETGERNGEAVNVVAVARTGERCAIVCRFTRDEDGKPVLAESQTFSGAELGGRLSRLFEPSKAADAREAAMMAPAAGNA